ncbi:indole-diterpene biosynthesis protein-like protein PaxU [Glonium stellatum]|uniref:Indole-diterpene biosynthesis protein-like protein PaxU n=1 Tax=Glonium stellatum TaxID=574774 RepID=A0A8E2ETG1_9PEZI|nr:indole-diterpene biosynthesis protein-like protein PaxU [Glonium stellatum]
MASLNALDGFQELSKVVYLYNPNILNAGYRSSPSRSQLSPPELIVLATWMGAAPRHIAKYTSSYRSLFPATQILLIMNFVPDIVLYPTSMKRQRLRPAVKVIQSLYSQTHDQRPRVLLHCFSNGGGYQVCQLAKVFKGMEGNPLPVYAMVLDSTPGKGTFRRSANAMLLSFPKSKIIQLLGSVIVYSMLCFMAVYHVILGKQNLVENLRKDLNDKTLFNGKAPRCYLYSEADQMVQWEDVEEHAEAAKQDGWKVEAVRFESSSHAGHIMEDNKKYWDAVNQIWKDAGI